ncbi:hypothetical protein D3C78_998360 [compost metagenome]
MGQRRAVGRVPWRGGEAVAVALGEAIAGGRIASDRLLQHLRLLALVVDFAEQPQLVPVAARMLSEFEEVAAAQGRLVAVALGQLVVGAVALQGASGQVLAARTVAEAPGVVVVLQVRCELAGEDALHLQARLLEVVVAAADPTGAGFQAYGEALDHRPVGHQAGVLLVGHRRQSGEYRLVVTEHQQVTVRRVLEVVVESLFLAQALHEVQIGFVVLHAVVARRVVAAELEALAVAFEDAVLPQYPTDDLRHCEVLEYALVAAVGQVGEARHQAQSVAGQALA